SPELSRHCTASRVKVDTEDTAAMRFKQLNSNQPNQAEASHHHTLAQRRLHQADTLQAYGSQYGERSRLIINVVGDLGTQVLWHSHYFSMMAVGYHAVTWPVTWRSTFKHYPSIAIA